MNFKSNNADKFLQELWTRISEYSLLNASKNDIGDYLIYLLNKYCEFNGNERFFDTLPNATLERVLKINTSKIKTSKRNIAVKYLSNTEYNTLFNDFLKKIADKNYKISTEGDKLVFIIDNPAMRDYLEARLKELNDTFDYTLNSEKVKVSIKSFFKMLLEHSKIKNALFSKDDLKNAILKVENKKNISSAKDMIDMATDIFESIKNPLEIPKTIKNIVSKLI